MIKKQVVGDAQRLGTSVPLCRLLLRVSPGDRADGLPRLSGEYANGVAKESLARELRGLARCQLPGPRRAGTRIGAGAFRVVLSKPRGLLSCRISPVVPTLGPDM